MAHPRQGKPEDLYAWSSPREYGRGAFDGQACEIWDEREAISGFQAVTHHLELLQVRADETKQAGIG